MPSWKETRLAVMVGDQLITPIESFTPTFALNAETIHSLEATHVGYVANPEAFTFTLSVRAIGSGAAQLVSLAMEGTEFTVGLFRAAGSVDNEWDFDSVVLDNCLITSASPSNATINGAPVATFSGVARRAQTTGAGHTGGAEHSLPNFSA